MVRLQPGATLKIHANDVTSFDLWTNALSPGQFPKQKGITQSGTDEFLIYSYGCAITLAVLTVTSAVPGLL